jgi:beta-mannosidase
MQAPSDLRHAFDMDNYIFYTQIMQAETLAAAYRLWRRNWKGRGKEYTSGALVWQVGIDRRVVAHERSTIAGLASHGRSRITTPVPSRAYHGDQTDSRPAFFSIARELRPYTVGMARKEVKKPRDNVTSAFFEITHEVSEDSIAGRC